MADYYEFYQLDDIGGSPVTSSKDTASRHFFTSADESATAPLAGKQWEAVTMGRGVIREGGKLSDANLEIHFTSTNEFAKSRMLKQFDARWWVDIAEGPDPTVDPPFWRGVFRRATPQGNRINLTFVDAIAALDIYGLPWPFQKRCRYNLYDGDTCQVSIAGREYDYTVTKIDAPKSEVEVSTTDTVRNTPWMKNGSLYQGRHVYTIFGTRSNNTVLNLSHYSGLKLGACKIVEGCDKSYYACVNQFQNGKNFGGFPDLPHSLIWGDDIVRHTGATTR